MMWAMHHPLRWLSGTARPDLAERTEMAIQTLQQAGWKIGEVQWQDRDHRMLKFAAQKNGICAFIECYESDLADRLSWLH